MVEKKIDETPLKILVVDDSEYSRKSIIQILEENNFNVVGEAANPLAAKELLVSTGANILIIDLVMPEMSGFDLTKHFKENFRDIYIIIVSSLMKDNVVFEALSLGASDFLYKPFPPQALINSINKIGTFVREEKS